MGHQLRIGEADGRLQWALTRVDNAPSTLTFERVAKTLRDYVSYVTPPTAPAPMTETMNTMETASRDPTEIEQ